nr:hypothetical protein [Variovorax terrae]
MSFLAGCVSTPLPPERPAPGPASLPPGASLPPPPTSLARSWDEYRLRAARRILQTSGSEAFAGQLPEVLQAIPVLQVQLNQDGSVRRIDVMRSPQFAPETIEMAANAIRRAAPFGPVAHLPHPWQFNETFLYNDDLKFQIRSLVESR